MLDLYDELTRLIIALENASIEYAVCGGIAMAIWQSVENVAATLGYTFKANPRNFANGAMKIRRVSKIDTESGDVLVLDLLLVTPAVDDVWQERTRVEWEHGSMAVVSRRGLAKLKRFRSSGRDLDDIALLEGES